MKRSILLLAILAFVAVSAAHGQTAAEYLEKAQQGLTANRPDDTIRDASEAIKLEPANATAYRLRAQAYATKLQQEPKKTDPAPTARSANAVNALADLDKAISLGDTDYFTYYFRGAVYYLISEFEPSLADLERAAQLKSDDQMVNGLRTTVKKRLASRYAYEGSMAAAEARKLTDAAEKRKKLDRAVELYSKSIALDPTDADSYSGRAYAYDDLERHDLAVKDLTQMIALKEDSVLTWYRRGLAYVALKDYDKALADFSAPIQKLEQENNLSNAADMRLELGRVYILKNDADKALAEIEKVVKASPRSHLAYYERGRAHALKGDAAKAEADFRKAMEIVPYHQDSVNELKKLGKTP